MLMSVKEEDFDGRALEILILIQFSYACPTSMPLLRSRPQSANMQRLRCFGPSRPVGAPPRLLIHDFGHRYILGHGEAIMSWVSMND